MSYRGIAKEDLSIPGVEVADWSVSLLFVIYVYYTIALLHDIMSKILGCWKCAPKSLKYNNIIQ
jgi:hypothetical protein